MALHATRTGYCHAADDIAVGVSRRHSYIDPAEFRHIVVSPDVLRKHGRVCPVMITLVLSGDFDFFPAHIEFGDQHTEFVVDRDLGLWPGKPGSNEKQPQPRLLGDSAPASTRSNATRAFRIPCRPRYRSTRSSTSDILR